MFAQSDSSKNIQLTVSSVRYIFALVCTDAISQPLSTCRQMLLGNFGNTAEMMFVITSAYYAQWHTEAMWDAGRGVVVFVTQWVQCNSAVLLSYHSSSQGTPLIHSNR